MKLHDDGRMERQENRIGKILGTRFKEYESFFLNLSTASDDICNYNEEWEEKI